MTSAVRADRPLAASLVALLAVLLAPAAARATGFHLSKFGGDLGYPTSPDAIAIFWNPAAMTQGKGTSILLENTLLFRRIAYDRTDPEVDDPSNVGPARLSNVILLPFVGAKSDFGLDLLHFGVAACPPFGMTTSWDPPDGPQRWHSVNGTLRAWYVTGAVAAKLPGNVSLGFSVSWVRTTIETLRATALVVSFDPATQAPTVGYTDDPAREGRALLDFQDDGAAYSFGIFWTPIPEVRLGLSYASRVEVSATGPVRQADAAGRVTEQRGRMVNTFPDAVHAGVEWDATERLTLRLGVSWVNWSLFDGQAVTVHDALGPGQDVRFALPRDYRDAFLVRGGAKYRFLDWLTVYLGAGWDQSPVPDHTLEGSLFDLDKVGVSGGAVFDVYEYVRLTIGYNHVFYIPVTVHGSRQTPSANGRYEGAVDVLHTSAELRF